MKSLYTYIVEKSSDLYGSETGLIIFDIDDTLVKADSSIMKIYKNEPGKQEIALTTDEYAKDPDAGDPNKKSWFDYRDFNDPLKVYDSIVKGTPLIKNLRIMDSYIKKGYDFCFLTARGCEDVVKSALDSFLEFRDKDGVLKKLGNVFKKSLSHAINDEMKNYSGNSDPEKKAQVLKNLCDKYDKVIFVDDDKKNVNAARKLNIKNLTVIKAWDE